MRQDIDHGELQRHKTRKIKPRASSASRLGIRREIYFERQLHFALRGVFLRFAPVVCSIRPFIVVVVVIVVIIIVIIILNIDKGYNTAGNVSITRMKRTRGAVG